MARTRSDRLAPTPQDMKPTADSVVLYRIAARPVRPQHLRLREERRPISLTVSIFLPFVRSQTMRREQT